MSDDVLGHPKGRLLARARGEGRVVWHLIYLLCSAALLLRELVQPPSEEGQSHARLETANVPLDRLLLRPELGVVGFRQEPSPELDGRSQLLPMLVQSVREVGKLRSRRVTLSLSCKGALFLHDAQSGYFAVSVVPLEAAEGPRQGSHEAGVDGHRRRRLLVWLGSLRGGLAWLPGWRLGGRLRGWRLAI